MKNKNEKRKGKEKIEEKKKQEKKQKKKKRCKKRKIREKEKKEKGGKNKKEYQSVPTKSLRIRILKNCRCKSPVIIHQLSKIAHKFKALTPKKSQLRIYHIPVCLPHLAFLGTRLNLVLPGGG